MALDQVKGVNRQLISLQSNADLTANRYRAARIFDSMTCGQVSATTNPIIGVQEDIPLSGTGRAVSVCILGQTLGVAAAAFTAGAKLTIDANGQFQAANTATQIIAGFAVGSALAASQVVSVFVTIDNSGF